MKQLRVFTASGEEFDFRLEESTNLKRLSQELKRAARYGWVVDIPLVSDGQIYEYSANPKTWSFWLVHEDANY